MPPTAVALCVPRASCSTVWSICSMVGIVFGFALPKFSITPSTVVKITSKSAGRRDATSAARLSFAKLQFGEGDRVVLVDDRHDAAFEQGHQRVARVEVTVVMFQVVMREQHLGDVEIELGKKRFVSR